MPSDRSWFVSLKARESAAQDNVNDRTRTRIDCKYGGNAKAIITQFDLKSVSQAAPVVLPSDVERELMGNFGIGLIMGPSGSGKSTVLEQNFKIVSSKPIWCNDYAVVSHFEAPADGIRALQAVGLNSIPAWLRPYEALSTGERARADLARKLASGTIVEDEFTSTLDRRTAMSVSVAVARYCRKHRIKRAIFASCHGDVAHALQPDWILWMPQGKLLRNHPRLDGSYPKGVQICLDTSLARANMQNKAVSKDKVTIGMRRMLHCKVVVDEHTHEAAQVMENNFYGESVARVPSLSDSSELEKLGKFGIGLIVGPSGSGKSSLLKQFGATQLPEWTHDASLIDHFANPEDGQERLRAVGIADPMLWLRPYSVLSMGEQHRADIARILASGVCIDEFTSTLDRTVAKLVASSISALCRKRLWSGLVFAACHADIGDFLQADWMYDTLSCSFKLVSPTPDVAIRVAEAEFLQDRKEAAPLSELDSDEELYNLCMEHERLQQQQQQQRQTQVNLVSSVQMLPPEPHDLFAERTVTIRVQRCAMDVWPRFAPHHYLSPFLAPRSMCFVATLSDEESSNKQAPFNLLSAVGFVASKPIELPYPSMYGTPAPNGAFRESRLVVIPELQGLGLGKLLSEGVAQLFVDQGIRYMSKAAHPRVAYRNHSELWRPAPDNGQLSYKGSDGKPLPHPRRCYNHEYVGLALGTPGVPVAIQENHFGVGGSLANPKPEIRRSARSRSPKRVTTTGLDDVEKFLSESPPVEDSVAMQLKTLPAIVQKAVLAQGSMVGMRNATAILLYRIRVACAAYAQCAKGTSAAVLFDVEKFLSESSSIDAGVAMQLKTLPVAVQQAVLAQGNLSGVENASAALVYRMCAARDVHAQCMKGTTCGLNDVEKFLSEAPSIQDAVAMQLKTLPAAAQQAVLAEGSLLSARDANAVLLYRIHAARDVHAQCMKGTLSGLNDVEKFLSEAPSIQDAVAMQLKTLPVAAQQAVLAQGSLLSARDANAVLLYRIRVACDAHAQCMATPSKTAVSMEPNRTDLACQQKVLDHQCSGYLFCSLCGSRLVDL